MLELLILVLAALLTSVLSAIIGMGGGMLLLAVMLGFLSHADTIPTHGAVQLVSNGTRILAFIRHVHWRILGRFITGALPGAVAGGALLYWLRRGHVETTEPYLKIGIGAYVLIMTFLPTRAVSHPPQQPDRSANRLFLLFGFLAGTLGLTIGAIGPLIAPLFLRTAFVKEKLIATKAICQATIHVLKIPVFLLLGREFVQYDRLWIYIIVMSVAVIPGTILGKRLLVFVNEKLFVRLYQAALLLAGFKVMCYDGVYTLIMSHSV